METEARKKMNVRFFTLWVVVLTILSRSYLLASNNESTVYIWQSCARSNVHHTFWTNINANKKLIFLSQQTKHSIFLALISKNNGSKFTHKVFFRKSSTQKLNDELCWDKKQQICT